MCVCVYPSICISMYSLCKCMYCSLSVVPHKGMMYLYSYLLFMQKGIPHLPLMLNPPLLIQPLDPLNSPLSIQPLDPLNSPLSIQPLYPLNPPLLIQPLDPLNSPLSIQPLDPLNQPLLIQPLDPLNPPLSILTSVLIRLRRFFVLLDIRSLDPSFHTMIMFRMSST